MRALKSCSSAPGPNELGENACLSSPNPFRNSRLFRIFSSAALLGKLTVTPAKTSTIWQNIVRLLSGAFRVKPSSDNKAATIPRRSTRAYNNREPRSGARPKRNHKERRLSREKNRIADEPFPEPICEGKKVLPHKTYASGPSPNRLHIGNQEPGNRHCLTGKGSATLRVIMPNRLG